MWLLKSIIFIFLIIYCESFLSRKNNFIDKVPTASPDAYVRLPRNIQPTSYTVELRLEENFFTTNLFSGTTSIDFEITNDEEIDTFQFHAKYLNITRIKIYKGIEPIETLMYTQQWIPETDFITVQILSETLLSGVDYKMVVSYEKRSGENSMFGLYTGSYVESRTNSQKYFAVTQLANIYAREVFPCFDEPGMKAVFQLSITYPVGYTVLSNTGRLDPVEIDPDNPNLETATFSKTPSMSPYLLAFVVSEFSCKSGNNTSDNLATTQVCTRMGFVDTTDKTALDAASNILDIMADFTNYTYSTGTAKMTLATLPDFAPRSMENWGLVIFRESDLLWNENESSNADKQRIVTTIAHELSHQWFGNLVTPSWWDDVFLSDGFATFFEYYAAALYETEWELEKQFVVDKLQTALVADSLDTALPLSYNIENGSRSDDIFYNKGGSIIRMVYHFLGDSSFKSGLANYISQNSYQTATSETLWVSFDQQIQSETLPATMTTIMDNWTKEPGYPLLTVSLSGDNLLIRQEQFSLSGNTNGTEWYVPVTYTLSSRFQVNDTLTKEWLIPGRDLTISGIMAGMDWVILNNQQVGYYRVNYDNTLLNKISNNVNNIDELSKAQIVDDQLNLARAGRKTYREVLNFLTFLKNDNSYYPWVAAFNGFNYLLQKMSDKTLKNALSVYILEYMKELNASVPIDLEKPEDQIYSLKQVLTLTWACKLGDENCARNTKQKFLDYKSNTEKPSSNLRSVVYCNGLRYSDDATADFRFLWQKYLSTQLGTERVTILKALGCANNHLIRRFYLSLILTDDVRRQDATYVFESIYSNYPEGVTEILDFIYDNHKSVVTRFGTSILTSLIESLVEFIVTDAQNSRLRRVANLEDLDETVKATAIAALDKIQVNLEIVKDIEDTFKEYFNSASHSGHYANVLCIILALLLFTWY